MKQVIINTYKFNELSEDAQAKAIDELRDINTEHEWWDNMYDDAENVGLKITSFDLDRNRHADGKFIESAEHCANKIIADHGDMCETYKTAENYLSERDSLIDTWERDDDGEFINEGDMDDKLNELDDDFLVDILEDYSILLQNEYEYRCTDEAVIETIDANEYDFLESGKIFNF
jgi:hypothetical protein